MRVVLDTNVLISALLKPASVPGRAFALSLTRALGVTIVYDARIALEYRTVLVRPKFKSVDRGAIDALLARLESGGQRLTDVAPYRGALTDEDDRMFVEVALAGAADAVITGNLRDYPTSLGFAVYPPATLLAMLETLEASNATTPPAPTGAR